MRISTIAILVSMIIGITVLCALGTWQVKRLFWKEALIAEVQARTAQPPVALDAFLKAQTDKENWPYSPVVTQGIYDHSKEVYFFTTSIEGRSGWNVHTPMLLENGKYIIVNRGFVPYDMQETEKRLEGQVKGKQQLAGLVRVPEIEKPNGWFPENDPDKRELYWRDYDVFVNLMGKNEGREFVPLFVDANDAPVPGGFPKGGTTIIAFSNSHLQYAVTWYGLALALLGVGGYFLYSRRQKNN
jgi:surfeit locus 1 family protein